MKYIFHKLKPIKEIDSNRWALKWKPIKNGTWNFYTSINLSKKRVYLRVRRSCAHNGWGRSWDGFALDMSICGHDILFWIHYNFTCDKFGALDEIPHKPLNFNIS